MGTGVLVDANILFSRTLRDWLFLLRNETEGQMYTVLATEDIIAETVYRYRRQYPTAPGGVITSLHDLITKQIDERVDDFEVDDSFPGTDPNDRHVHAAAVSSGADMVLTGDKGFTELAEEQLDSLPYSVYTPDDFFCLVAESHRTGVRNVTGEQARYWLARDGEVDLAMMLVKADCPEFARVVAKCLSGMP